MKKLLLATATTLAFAGAAFAEPVKVGIAAEAYPPFASPDASGNWVGWEVDMIGAVCKAAELECEIVPVAWDGIIPALTAGQIRGLRVKGCGGQARPRPRVLNPFHPITSCRGRCRRWQESTCKLRSKPSATWNAA
mgnify:CR=1 FL=1